MKLKVPGLNTSYHNNITENNFIAVALQENRIVLTRKTAFPDTNKNIPVLFILDNNPENQFKQVV